MFGSVVLDAAIGLALLFLFVSLICSAIREAIEAVLNERAAALERGVRTMLDDPDGTGLAATVMEHPLVRPLRARPYPAAALRRPMLRSAAAPSERVMPLGERAALPAYILPRGFARALLDAVVRNGGGAPGTPLDPDTVRAAAAGAPEPVRVVILDALERGGADLERVTAELERWFDTAMVRLNGWYRRRTRAVLFAIGLFVAAGMNVDAFAVGQALFADKALRDVAVADAERDGDSLARLQHDLGGIRFPVGWDEPLPQRLRAAPDAPLDPAALIRMLAGWVVTAFAVTMGGPFWFDLLGRFVAVRAVSKPG